MQNDNNEDLFKKRIEERKKDAEKMKELFLGKMTGLNHTYRFSGKMKNKDQSVSEHSYWTAIISLALTIYENKMRKKYANNLASLDVGKVLSMALLHDVEEVITGDINHLFKHSSSGQNFRKELDDLVKKEANLELFQKIICGEELEKFWLDSHEDSEINYIIKISDWLQLLQYVLEEKRRGNSYFQETLERVSGLLTRKTMEEIEKERLLYIPFLIRDLLQTIVIKNY